MVKSTSILPFLHKNMLSNAMHAIIIITQYESNVPSPIQLVHVDIICSIVNVNRSDIVLFMALIFYKSPPL